VEGRKTFQSGVSKGKQAPDCLVGQLVLRAVRWCGDPRTGGDTLMGLSVRESERGGERTRFAVRWLDMTWGGERGLYY